MTVYALSIHADWRCGRSGACCTSGWPIPVERALDGRLRRALQDGTLVLPAAAEPRAPDTLLARLSVPDPEHASLAGVDGCGRCVFFEPGAGAAPAACALQRQLGFDALPVACRLFPRVGLLEPRGVSIALSHYCPTAAVALMRDDRPLAIVRDPPAFPDDGTYEGLDARAALPPLLRPDALLDWDSHARWERHALSVLERDDLSPEAALDLLTAQAERVRAWSVADGALADWMEQTFAAVASAKPRRSRGRAADHGLFRRVLASVPASARALARDVADVPADAAALAVLDERHVAPAWPAFERPARRYLAARAFGSWCAHQGRGLRTSVLYLRVALALLRVQAARLAARAERVLDRALFLEALRASDLLLLHLVAREHLAAALSQCEERA